MILTSALPKPYSLTEIKSDVEAKLHIDQLDTFNMYE